MELARRGLDVEDLFRQANMPYEHLQDPNARYPFSSLQRLWRLAVQATGDPCFGLEVGRAWSPTTFHALGYSALASPTLREALGSVERYCRVISTGARVELVQHDDEMHVVLGPTHKSDAIASRNVAGIQAGMASITTLCRIARNGPIPLKRVLLTTTDAAGRARMEEFFECPVVLGAEYNALVIDVATMDTPLPAPNAELRRINERALIDYLARVSTSDVAARVHALLIRLLPSAHVQQDEIARHLNMSPRSMQRWLRDQGTSFRELLDETRRELALQYTADGTLSASEIAYLLGFSEPSSLSRAMSRWKREGAAPARPRRPRPRKSSQP